MRLWIGQRAPTQLVGSEFLDLFDLQISLILLHSAGNHQPGWLSEISAIAVRSRASLTNQGTAWQILGCDAPWASPVLKFHWVDICWAASSYFQTLEKYPTNEHRNNSLHTIILLYNPMFLRVFLATSSGY